MKPGLRNSLMWLSALWNLFSVPAAAAIVGWVCAPVFAAWVLDSIEFDTAIRVAMAQSPLFLVGVRTALAALLFFIAWRYLA
jgi:hypothetical protein